MRINNKNSTLRRRWDFIMSHLNKEAIQSKGAILTPTVAELNNTDEVYYITSKALKIIHSIDIKDASYSILRSLPIKTTASKIYVEGHDNNLNTFRYDGKMLHMAAITFDEGTDGDDRPITYTHYKINLETNEFHCNHMNSKEQEYFDTIIMKELIYMFLSDIDIQILPINGDNGLSRANGKVKNETTTPINLVTEKWNTLTIRVGDYGVRGHMRLQPCGKDRLQRRLIYIAPFMKHKYTSNRQLNP